MGAKVWKQKDGNEAAESDDKAMRTPDKHHNEMKAIMQGVCV